jgi:hypothetical protein
MMVFRVLSFMPVSPLPELDWARVGVIIAEVELVMTSPFELVTVVTMIEVKGVADVVVPSLLVVLPVVAGLEVVAALPLSDEVEVGVVALGVVAWFWVAEVVVGVVCCVVVGVVVVGVSVVVVGSADEVVVVVGVALVVVLVLEALVCEADEVGVSPCLATISCFALPTKPKSNQVASARVMTDKATINSWTSRAEYMTTTSNGGLDRTRKGQALRRCDDGWNYRRKVPRRAF